jgi:predicted lysophospholipase L1 biosynthesis ABC-type transport system permease subunit
MDYIRNSKNRKLKTQILQFFSRIAFGTHRLGIPGKGIFICMIGLLLSLLFPWITFVGTIDATPTTYSAFSIYTGGIGYGILFSLGLVSFFLLSHAKKESLRAYVPFRLSDAQAIVFIDAMIITSLVHFLIVSLAYGRLAANTVSAGFGLELALVSALLLLVAAFFFSQSEKSRAVSLGYLAKSEESALTGYEDIIADTGHKSKEDTKNMSLPI